METPNTVHNRLALVALKYGIAAVAVRPFSRQEVIGRSYSSHLPTAEFCFSSQAFALFAST
jgi:hypothetical protein